MKRIFLLLAICCCTSVIYAQEPKEAIYDDLAFLELKEESIKLFFSQDYKDVTEYRKTFSKKIGTTDYDRSNLTEWLEQNLSKTQFDSVEEGVELHNKFLESQKKTRPIHKKLAKMSNDLSDKYGHEEFLKASDEKITKTISRINISDMIAEGCKDKARENYVKDLQLLKDSGDYTNPDEIEKLRGKYLSEQRECREELYAELSEFF